MIIVHTVARYDLYKCCCRPCIFVTTSFSTLCIQPCHMSDPAEASLVAIPSVRASFRRCRGTGVYLTPHARTASLTACQMSFVLRLSIVDGCCSLGERGGGCYCLSFRLYLSLNLSLSLYLCDSFRLGDRVGLCDCLCQRRGLDFSLDLIISMMQSDRI